MQSVHRFVEELISFGIEEVIISPGSRSTPLAVLFERSAVKTYVAVDERCGAYMAIGLIKATKRPVALLCTSGTASANYYPAVIEAAHSELPLLVITADRPSDAQFIGSPQTINQNNLFGQFTKHFEVLNENDAYTSSLVQRSFINMMTKPYGVSHINVPIADPFMDLKPLRTLEKKHINVNSETNALTIGHIKYGKTLILCGPSSSLEDINGMISISEKLNAPILADPLSNIRQSNHENIMDVYEVILNNKQLREELKPDVIILVGHIMLSKRVQKFLLELDDVQVIQLGESNSDHNIALSTSVRFMGSINSFYHHLKNNIHQKDYLKQWINQQNKHRENVRKSIQEKIIFEGKIINVLQQNSNHYDAICTSNSTIIRSMDLFYEKGDDDTTVYCNRGTNGIEGTISTAFGVSASENKTVLLTGDLSFHHDLNGILLGNMNDLSLLIILVNNGGGGIFEYLPQRQLPCFEKIFKTNPNSSYSGLEELYGLTYKKATDWTSFENNLEKLLPKSGIRLLEVIVDSEISVKLHQEYLNDQTSQG